MTLPKTPKDPAATDVLAIPFACLLIDDDAPVPLHVHLTDLPRFPLGCVTITANAMEAIRLSDVGEALHRHARGDWSELGKHERESNELALSEGGLIASFYTSQTGKRFWILTEADRSTTTIMMPFDY